MDSPVPSEQIERCEVICDSGAYGGRRCPKASRFTVADKRTCGRHVAIAVERASRPGSRVVGVNPDFYQVG